MPPFNQSAVTLLHCILPVLLTKSKAVLSPVQDRVVGIDAFNLEYLARLLPKILSESSC